MLRAIGRPPTRAPLRTRSPDLPVASAPPARFVAALAATIALVLTGGIGALAMPAAPADAGPRVEQASAELVDLEQVALEAARPVVDRDRTDAFQHRDEIAPPPPGSAPEPPPEPAPEPPSESMDRFAAQFPAHAAATQVDGDPASFHWAVIIGVNDYQGRVGDTFGSVPDALVLRDLLLARGWRPEHVLVLTDGDADHDGTVRALEWLVRSTDERSTVVFSSSGHIRHAGGRTGLWPSDNRFLWAEDLGRMLGAIRSDRMWISLQGCHAGGLSAPGVEGAGRVVTYSSPVTQKSYEDPETQHSLQGYYMFAEGIRDGWADADGDGRISVQEAHAWGAPRAEIRSAQQQSPVMVDGLGAPFHLDIPGA